MSKFLKMLSIVTIILSFTSCSTGVNTEIDNKEKLSYKDCLNYMDSKYGQSFSLVNDNGVKLTSSFLEVHVQDSLNNVAMAVEELTGNSIVYHDNYIAVKFDKQLEDFIQPIANESFGKCIVLNEVDFTRYQPDDYNSTTTFEEFKMRSDSKIYLQVLLPPTYEEKDLNKALDTFKTSFINNSIVGTCDIYVCTDDELYNTIDSTASIANNEKYCIRKYQLRTEIVNGSINVVGTIED